MFRQGMHDLKVWPGVEGDGGEPTTTPGRTSSSLAEDQMGRLAKVGVSELVCLGPPGPHVALCCVPFKSEVGAGNVTSALTAFQ